MEPVEPVRPVPPGKIRPVTRSKRQARDAYDLLSRRYDRLAGWSERPSRLAGLRRLAAAEGERVLEVGFGTGQALAELAKAVGVSGKVYGLDLSDGMLEVAKARLWREGLMGSVDLRLGDGAHLPFGESSFDAAFMSFTLELFDTPEIPVALGECLRVLRPAGRLVVVALSREHRGKLLPRAFVRLYEWVHDRWPVSVDCRPIYAASEVRQAGFVDIGAEMRSMWGLPVEVVLGRKPERALSLVRRSSGADSATPG